MDEDNDLEFSNSTLIFTSNVSSSSAVPVVPTTIPFVPLGLGLLLLTIFGIIGNTLSAIVLSKKKFRSSYSVLTLGLAFVDSAYLFTKLLRFGFDALFKHLDVFTYYTSIFLPFFGPILRPLTFTAQTASTYFTMAIALDRFIALSRPKLARTFCTTKQAMVSSCVVILFASLYNIPRWFEFYTSEYVEFDKDLSTNATKYYMKLSELRANENYRVYYIFWSYFVVMFFLPFVTLTVLNCYVWISIRRIQSSSMTADQKRNTSYATMLVGVVIVFLFCSVDFLVLDILDHFGVKYHTFWYNLGNFLLTINSAVNFIIYCICGRKFRKEFLKTFRSCCFLDRKSKSSSSKFSSSQSGGRTQAYIDMHNLN